jgi:hypothetical protein
MMTNQAPSQSMLRSWRDIYAAALFETDKTGFPLESLTPRTRLWAGCGNFFPPALTLSKKTGPG